MTEPDIYEARMKGTIDLDPESRAATSLDGLAFAVIAFRVEEEGATKMTKDGLRRRKDIFNVEDARVLVGDLREQAVQFLAGKALELPSEEELQEQYIETLKEAARQKLAPVAELPPAVDDLDGVVEVPSGTITHVNDYKKTAKAESSSRDGVKVGKFVADDAAAIPAGGEVEQLGSIHSEGYRGKDKILRKFMEQ